MKRCGRSLLCALVCMAVLSVSSQALGQGQANYYEWDEEQFSLFEKGSAAFKAADYPAAIEFFKASLAIGEMNITLINLGRVHFKNGECVRAKEIFDKVPSAPQVREPSPALVLQKLNQYRSELMEKCPGQVQLRCDPINMKVSS